jgi:hypothetical protein
MVGRRGEERLEGRVLLVGGRSGRGRRRGRRRGRGDLMAFSWFLGSLVSFLVARGNRNFSYRGGSKKRRVEEEDK